MAIGLSLCAGRLVQLQGFDSASYSNEALTRTLPLLPARGEITDRNGEVFASTQATVAVTADPSLTTPRAGEIAGVLSSHLGMTQAQLMPLLTKTGTRFVYIKKRVPALTYSAIASELSSRGVYGVFREADPVRSYPNGSVGGPLVGFVGASGKGLGGLELSMNKELSGVEGKQKYEAAPNGSRIPLGRSSITPAQNGLNLQTTIDSELQWTAERLVAARVRKTRADWGFAVVIAPKTGEILALANAPTYNPAKLQKSKPEDRGNRAVSAPYEPGSVQKILTSAALIDSGTATPTTKVVIPPLLPSGGATIKDHFYHGELQYNMRGIIANSSNIGTALLTRQLDKTTLREYMVRFGLGAPTGVELPGEAAGIIPAADMSDGQRDQVAFGQALAVTGVQQAAAIAGIVNDGEYHPPTILRRATDSTGKEVPLDRPESRQVITPKSSKLVRELMQAVIDSPNGQKNLRLDAYSSGGKTGTAQRADTKCHCYKGYTTSFVGFAPLDDPQLLTYVVLSNPRKGDTGSRTAAPVYRDIMNFALPRYSVKPDAKRHDPLPTEW